MKIRRNCGGYSQAGDTGFLAWSFGEGRSVSTTHRRRLRPGWKTRTSLSFERGRTMTVLIHWCSHAIVVDGRRLDRLLSATTRFNAHSQL